MRELLCRQRGEAANAAAQQGFSKFLLRIGDGREPVHADLGDSFLLPCALLLNEPAALLDTISGTDEANLGTIASWLAEAPSPPRTLMWMPSTTTRCRDFQARCAFLWPTIN